MGEKKVDDAESDIAASAAVTKASKHKVAGNNQFKRGKFIDSIREYERALYILDVKNDVFFVICGAILYGVSKEEKNSCEHLRAKLEALHQSALGNPWGNFSS